MSKANKSAGDERKMRGQEQVKVQEYINKYEMQV